jgi:putative transposase
MSERREQVHKDQELTKTRRCKLLEVSRSSAYYVAQPVREEELALMRLIDEIYLRWPFYGSRRIRDELETGGQTVNRKRVQRLMREMGLQALYPRRRTSQPGKGTRYTRTCQPMSVTSGPNLAVRRLDTSPPSPNGRL